MKCVFIIIMMAIIIVVSSYMYIFVFLLILINHVPCVLNEQYMHHTRKINYELTWIYWKSIKFNITQQFLSFLKFCVWKSLIIQLEMAYMCSWYTINNHYKYKKLTMFENYFNLMLCVSKIKLTIAIGLHVYDPNFI